MEETCEDIDEMFSNLLGEMDLLTQSLGIDSLPPPAPAKSASDMNFSFGFRDLNESLNALEDNDLDALMADLVADLNETEIKSSNYNHTNMASLPYTTSNEDYFPDISGALLTAFDDDVQLPQAPPTPPMGDLVLPPPPPDPTDLGAQEDESKMKADKIKLALGKMKEAKVKKLIVKVHMNDSSTKTLMVDERQTVREVLDNLFEKTHCDCTIEWCLYEVHPELQIERFFEDHENVVEILSDWTRDSENKIHFSQKKEKYAVFKNPQNFYLARKGSSDMKDMNEKNKMTLLEQSFCGASVVVPELEGALYLREDGKKSWKKRYFLLRASGIYYVPKGKTKTSRDLACFIQFENVNVYYGTHYKVKYKAPTDNCFVLKHPQIQKESQYIKYLCCDDPWILHQWVTGIRIAKYGKILYENYKTAVQRAGLASHWSALVNSSASSSTGSAQGNGQISQSVPMVSTTFSEAWKRGETAKQEKKPDEISKPESKSGTPALVKRPPPTPTRRSSSVQAAVVPPPLPSKAKHAINNIPPLPSFEPPELLQFGEDFLPPPPAEFMVEEPPDFLPPPPPNFTSAPGYQPLSNIPEPPSCSAPGLPPPPPPPPPTASQPKPVVKKPLPTPPKRQENTGVTQQQGAIANSNGGGQPDFMSDLMKALQKKRGSTS